MVKKLTAAGWLQVRQAGSHRQFKHTINTGTVTLAGKPGDDLAEGTIKSIERQAGWVPVKTTNERTRTMDKDLKGRVAALEQLAAEMYQVAGAIGAPVRVLDQLAAASDGKALPHQTILPFDASECLPLPSVAAAVMGRKGGSVVSSKKSIAARMNGIRFGGRPAKFKTGDVVVFKHSAPAVYRDKTGTVVRRADDRALFYVRVKGESKAEAVRTWWMEKKPRLAAKKHRI